MTSDPPVDGNSWEEFAERWGTDDPYEGMDLDDPDIPLRDGSA